MKLLIILFFLKGNLCYTHELEKQLQVGGWMHSFWLFAHFHLSATPASGFIYPYFLQVTAFAPDFQIHNTEVE